MRFHFATIPVFGSEQAATALNQFVATHRVLAVDRHLVPDGPRSAWAVCVTYTEGFTIPGATEGEATSTDRERVDYKQVLNDDFSAFARFRELRKVVSKRDGLPIYAVFTNELLAEMVQAEPAVRSRVPCQSAGCGRTDEPSSGCLPSRAGDT